MGNITAVHIPTRILIQIIYSITFFVHNFCSVINNHSSINSLYTIHWFNASNLWNLTTACNITPDLLLLNCHKSVRVVFSVDGLYIATETSESPIHIERRIPFTPLRQNGPHHRCPPRSISYLQQNFVVVNYPDSKVHGANMGPIWGRQDPGGPHGGPMNFAI